MPEPATVSRRRGRPSNDRRAIGYLQAIDARCVSIEPGAQFSIGAEPSAIAIAAFWLPADRIEGTLFRATQLARKGLDPATALFAATAQCKTIVIPHARAVQAAKLACEQLAEVQRQRKDLAALIRGAPGPYLVAVPLHGLMMASVLR